MVHKIGRGMTGKHHTIESKILIGKSNTGKIRSESTKKLMGLAATASNLKTWQNPEIRKKRIEGLLKGKLGGRNKDDIIREEKKLIEKGYSSMKIAKLLNISNVTVKTYVKNDLKYRDMLLDNGRKSQSKANFKNGQSALYEKLRKEIREKKIKCEECGSIKNVEIHHKEKIHYDKGFNASKADNWFHNKENIRFLCNSCHQKLHYRELGRVRCYHTRSKVNEVRK